MVIKKKTPKTNGIKNKVDRAFELQEAMKDMKAEFDEIKGYLKEYAEANEMDALFGHGAKAKVGPYNRNSIDVDAFIGVAGMDAFMEVASVPVAAAKKVLSGNDFKAVSLVETNPYGKISIGAL